MARPRRRMRGEPARSHGDGRTRLSAAPCACWRWFRPRPGRGSVLNPSALCPPVTTPRSGAAPTAEAGLNMAALVFATAVAGGTVSVDGMNGCEVQDLAGLRTWHHVASPVGESASGPNAATDQTARVNPSLRVGQQGGRCQHQHQAGPVAQERTVGGVSPLRLFCHRRYLTRATGHSWRASALVTASGSR